ncbi:hypothetical protein BH24ACT3_BH24ACT3_08590 [soil metagenome]
MAAMWRKAMLYLGLGPDEEYDDYDVPDDVSPQPSAVNRSGRSAGSSSGGGSGSAHPVEPSEPASSGAVRTSSPQRADDGNGGVGGVATRPRSAVVRPMPVSATAKPHVVVPTSFNQAQEVADKFKGNQPVIVNLQGADRDLSRRLIDFASGLCYGLGGQMDKVATQVYLLTPSNVEVSPEERRRLQERGLYDG